ncbi:Ripk4 [Symbiodinium sp. CCMP2592]|nr:Ripk4 [Symbiodinium sp. CCMP2592]
MVPPTPSAGMASRCSVLKAPSRGGLTKRGSSRTVSTNADHRATRAASEAAANHPPHFLHDELAGMQDQSKLGWKLIDAALERFNKDSVSRYDNLVPLRLPILDLAKRSTDQMPELALPSVQAWFDKYLRILFGEDTPRYKMMKMAISMRRALFLFEGLDAAGQLREAVEILIQGFVKEGHFLLMTSRRLPQGSSLESLPEHIVAMEMQPLSDEQKRAIAHSRLGLQGLQSFNTFLTKIRRGQRGSDGGETQEQDDIFGNPMMLSMLLCYLSPKAGDETEHRSPATDGEGVDLMAVYRVSVTVMLKRMLLQQQADRHINEELLEDCSRVLERAAMNMQAKRDTQIECEAFEKELTIQLKERWTKNLRASVDLGRAMLLRMHREGNRTMIRFMIKGFQDYFSACAISKGDDSDHLLDQVSYQALLKDDWWAQMLDMLAQAWPKQYVQLMEKKIDKFKDEHGGSALHLAAKVGHVPIFRLVKKFSDANQVLSAKNAEDQTPLHVAAENGHHAVCQLIIEKKGSVDVEDSKERLPLHLALQSGHFSLARFLLDKLEEEASMQPAAHSNQKKEDLSERLARRILSKSTGDEPLDEEDFLGEVPNIFPEMKYFRKEEQNEYKRQMASLLSVYWVCSDDYDSFARKQSDEEKLKEESWEGLQEWAKNKVQMTPRRVAAVLVYCAIAGIGKIAPFQKHFAADATEPISALASIVQRHSVLVPSFQRLDDEEQHLILGCLKAHANFNFGQFLQAESLPVSLFKCKELVMSQEETMTNVFGFFLFTVFMSLCAILGVKSLEGSLFMTEEMYKNFKVGLESLTKLTDAESGDVYNGFLRKRAELAGVEFDEESPTLEQKAIVRLSCLTRIFEKEKGSLVFEAFMSLPPGVREELTGFLNADGLSKRGFLLMHSPNLMCNAFQNKNLSLDKAMRQLLKMYQLSEEAFPAPADGEAGVITVMVEEMATHAKKCEDAESFDSTNLEVSKFQGVNADRTAKIVLSPWQNNTDKRLLISLDEDVSELFYDVSVQTVTESSFIQRLKTCFPELKYLDGDDPGVPELRKRTLCTMLCIYWLAGDRHEEFIRGQAVASQLQESSWQWIQQWISPMLEDPDVMNVVCAAVMVKAVCRIPKFQKQQAPGILDLRDVMKHVLENCPKVLPSYQRLEEDDRHQLAECLSHDIELERLVNAESCPAGLGVVRELVQLSRDAPEVATRRSFDSLSLLLWSSFLDLAGSMGNESQEGSFYMTEERYQKIFIAQESLQKMRSDSCSETEVYDFLLEKRVEKHVTFEPDPESKACARLACLANIRNSSDAADVREALCSSEVLKTPEERARMVRYLTSAPRERHSVVEPEAAEEQTPSALVERPSFALREATSFLEKARDNPEIGISQATRILLRVFDEATKEFNGVDAAMVHIDFTELASFAADFVGSAKFQDVPFELKRTTPTAFEATVIPKVWIPVSNEQVLEKLKKNAVELCMDLRDHKLPERVFRDRIAHIYPEMAYFGPNATNLANQTVCSLCCVYWLLSNQHEAFIRGQPSDCQLSRQSWAWIQDWLQKSVRLTTPEKIDAVLTIMAIHALGKFPAFRADFPYVKHHTQEMHDLALAQILQNNPEVVPSFNRLDAETKKLIIDCLSVDFEFSQFLLGENTAANLVMVKDRLKGHGQNGHSFFLFRIFAQMCGKLGPKSQSGCLFMNENQFKRCTPGLKALQALWKLDGKACYNDFILLRGSKAMSRFASPEHQALSRLLCLFDAYDKDGGSALCNAFDELAVEERQSLTQWLNSDSEKCCVIIPGASTMLQNAKANTNVGLPRALRFLLKVREQCQQHEKNSSCSRRVIQFGNIATWAKDYRGDTPGESWEEPGPDQGLPAHRPVLVPADPALDRRFTAAQQRGDVDADAAEATG